MSVDRIEVVELDKRESRIIRNVHRSTAWVSSRQNFTEDEVRKVIDIGSNIKGLTDASALAEGLKSQGLSETGKQIKTMHIRAALSGVAMGMVAAHLRENGGFDPNNPVHNFIEAVAADSVARACVNLGIATDLIERENLFEKNHGQVNINGETLDVKGVCAAPGIARSWISACEDAIKSVFPESIQNQDNPKC